MTGLHESTLALSVYNAIARHGTMTREQALAVLQRAWESGLEASEVDTGVAYLLQRKMVTDVNGVLSPARTAAGAAATVVRNPLAQTELVYSKLQQKAPEGMRLDAR